MRKEENERDVAQETKRIYPPSPFPFALRYLRSLYFSYVPPPGIHTTSRRIQKGWEERGALRVPNIPRATRVGNLKKLISTVVLGLQSRFVFIFSDLFSHGRPPSIRSIWIIRIRTHLYAECIFATEFDLSNMRVAVNINR